MTARIVLRDIDNRDDGGAPYEFTGSPEKVAGYLDGPLRRDLREGSAALGRLEEAIAAVRSGDLDAANAILNRGAAVYLRAAS